MSELKVNKITPRSGTTVTLGDSGDSVNIASGATITDFTSTGIDDNATSTAITINSSETTILQCAAGDSNFALLAYHPTSTATRTIAKFQSNVGGTQEDKVVIKTSGDVGIGIASPVGQLTLNKSSDLNFLQGGYGISWGATSGSSPRIIGSASSNIRIFHGGGSEAMRITSTGGVNVGSGVLSAASNDGDVVVGLGVVVGTYNGDNRIAASSLGGGSATLYIGNAAIQVSSDRRLKTNIADTTMSAIDKIKQVRIVDFNWNDPSDTSYNNRNARGTWTGVIAQELIDVFPFAVNAPRKEEDLSIDTESEKKWQVDQANLVPVLMKAIQEQQTQIEELKARITALENA